MRSLVEILRHELKAVSQTELAIAENEAMRTGEKIEQALTRLGIAKDETIAEAWAIQYELPIIKELAPRDIDLDWLSKRASVERAASSLFLPLVKSNGRREFAIVNPTDLQTIDFIRSLEARAEYGLTTAKALRRALEEATTGHGLEKIESLVQKGALEGAGTEAMEQLIDAIFHEAIKRRATDVHIEPAAETAHVYVRIDGLRQPLLSLPKKLHQPIVNIIKIRADIKPDQHFTPDDKKFVFVSMGRAVDIRVSLLPSIYGPTLVNRILDKMSSLITLEDLGYSKGQYDEILNLIKSPNGLIVITGPTGSGKSTTLYAILSRLSRPETKTISLEDPIEFTIPRITQCQVREDRGFTFARALRSVLRHDPNIIMIGEIRDNETARIAMEASLTGHLVFSTLHTNSAVATVIRLVEMEIPTVYIASTLRAVVAQKLLRKLCPECKREAKLPQGIVEKYALKTDLAWTAGGCHACAMSGYRGRTVAAEILTVDQEIAEMIHERRPAAVIRRTAIERGFIPIETDAVNKAAAGITDLKEVENAIGAL